MLIILLLLSLIILKIEVNIKSQLQSINTQLNKRNVKIHQIQQKLNILVQNFSTKQTKQKKKQSSQQKQNKSAFTDLLNKIISINKNMEKKINQQNDKQMNIKNKIKQINQKISKLSNQTIQQKSIQKQFQQQLQKIQQTQQKQAKFIANDNSDITIHNLQLNFQTSQQFSNNFIINNDTNSIKRSKFTYQFQPLISSQALPNEGIYQLTIRIKNILKGWIYFGIISTSISDSNITQLFKPSLHQFPQFIGYSGYSGRIWESSIPKTKHKHLLSHDLIKLQINMNQQIIQYFINNQKITESEINCKKEDDYQCRIAIEMYNENDQIQFLREIKLESQEIDRGNQKEDETKQEIL